MDSKSISEELVSGINIMAPEQVRVYADTLYDIVKSVDTDTKRSEALHVASQVKEVLHQIASQIENVTQGHEGEDDRVAVAGMAIAALDAINRTRHALVALNIAATNTPVAYESLVLLLTGLRDYSVGVYRAILAALNGGKENGS